MVYYQNNSTNNVETGTHFEEIGEISLEDIGTLPFYYFKFKYTELKRDGKEQ